MPAMHRSRRIGAMLINVFACALASTVSSASARDAEVGKPAPPIVARTLSGDQFSLAAQRGTVVIINVWATWCGPCRAEMPALDAFYKKHRADGLALLAVSADVASDLPQVREVMKNYGFPAAVISEAQMSGYGRMRQIPQTYVIDADGMLRRDGMVDKGVVDTALLEEVVAPLLRQVDAAHRNADAH